MPSPCGLRDTAQALQSAGIHRSDETREDGKILVGHVDSEFPE